MIFYGPAEAFCSHCPGKMGLLDAIEHRRQEHPECLSCQAEILLFAAVLRTFTAERDHDLR